MKLSSSTLASLPAHIQIPSYDRSRLIRSIVHIGVGAFHRAHQALYLDDLIENTGSLDYGICGVGLLPQDEKIRDVMKAQDCLYTVLEKSASGKRARVVGSITDFLFAPENPERVIEQLARSETRIVSLTITEGGYSINQATGDFEKTSAVRHDLNERSKPVTVFGYITEALRRRRENGFLPFTIMSCDNLQHNGDVARKAFCSFTEMQDPDLAEWIHRNVAFPNSMVDRITPATCDDDRKILENEFGIEDAWPVACEPFRQWVIEERFSNGRPEFERVGVAFTEDVHPYETMKIRLLNGSHSAMGYLGYLAGYRYIHEIMADPEFREYIMRLMREEVAPVLLPVPDVNLKSYKETLLERFANPEIKDQALRICLDGSDKIPKFILPTIRERIERGSSVRLLSLVVAAWFRFLSGSDERGERIPIEDPRAEDLKILAQKGGEDPSALLSRRDLFGELGTSSVFLDGLSSHLRSLYSLGARKTLHALLHSAG